MTEQPTASAIVIDAAGTGPRRPSRDPVPWLIAAGVLIAYGTISLSRYWRLQPGSYDLGIFTEYVKQYAHVRAPIVDARLPGMDLLGDHFHPIVALLAPFFLLFPSPATLLVGQALLTAVSVLPVYRAASQFLGAGAGYAVCASYGLCWGLQQMVNFDFHEVAFAVPLLAFSLSALVCGKTRRAALWALLLVLVKEDLGFTVAAIGIVIALACRRRVTGIALAAWGAGWSLAEILVIIPHFNPEHRYAYLTYAGSLTPGGIWHQLLASSEVKLTTLALILLPTAFAALRSPLILIAAPDLLMRFVSVNPGYWGTDAHYNATVMPVVFLAAVDGLRRIHARRPDARLYRHGPAMMLAACAALAFQFPLANLWQPSTYKTGPGVAAARGAMALVPDGATVATTIDLLAPLGARADAFWLGNSTLWLGKAGNPATEYVIYDRRIGDVPPPPAGESVLLWAERLSRNVPYRLIYDRDGIYVFRKAVIGG